MNINYESVKRIKSLKQSIESATGKTYSDLTSAIQGLKDSGLKIDNFVKDGADLGDVTLSNNVRNLRSGAFARCYVGNITLSESISSIPRYAFYRTNFRSGTTVFLPNSLRTIEPESFMEADMSSIILPEGVTSIGESAFAYCFLRDITIPSSVTEIGDYAFAHNTQLENATIDGTDLQMGSDIFAVCSNLTTITFVGGTPISIEQGAFVNCNKLTTINVPWSEGEVAGAPWYATKATINYNYTGG